MSHGVSVMIQAPGRRSEPTRRPEFSLNDAARLDSPIMVYKRQDCRPSLGLVNQAAAKARAPDRRSRIRFIIADEY